MQDLKTIMKNFIKNSVSLAILSYFVFSTTAMAGTVARFTDMQSENDLSEIIESLANEGIINGYPDGTFRPENLVNRAEIVKLVNEAFTDFSPNKKLIDTCFNDVPARSWFTPYVCYSKEKNYINGYPDGSFKPQQDVNLVEALKIVTLPINGEQNNAEVGEDWYKNMLVNALEKNYIPTTFVKPDQKVSRGEMAEIIYRVKKGGAKALPQNHILMARYSEGRLDPLKFAGETIPKTNILLNVPFSSQAPYGRWIIPFDEACEETSILMINHYLTGEELNRKTATEEIREMTKWVADHGMAVDISSDQIAFIIRNFLGKRARVYANQDVTIQNIETLLTMGYPVIVPVAGRTIGNRNYAYPGPPYHVLVIIGYDENHFYANDPGTSFGENYVYDKNKLFEGIHDWAGSKNNVLEGRKAMIIMEDDL